MKEAAYGQNTQIKKPTNIKLGNRCKEENLNTRDSRETRLRIKTAVRMR